MYKLSHECSELHVAATVIRNWVVAISIIIGMVLVIGKYGSTSYIKMTRKKKAANRKGIHVGPTTLKRACNSTTNTRTKYLSASYGKPITISL